MDGRVKTREAGSAVAGSPAREPDTDRLREQLDAYMNEHGLRNTEQRRVIVDTFFEFGAHATVDELLAEVRKADSRIGYATVYRTLKMLSESGVVDERRFDDGITRYELADDDAHHDHLICTECGFIQEFEEPLIEELQERVAARFGFSLAHHKLELYGTCQRPGCTGKKER
ncbi:MAG: transcriptional repressor [Polyangiaceae bacterium]|nr:transcriptional repressor [Polyangiaceae bacterium]MCW5791655.1 transcriptional repressor [Polyangiaceae bacterium]